MKKITLIAAFGSFVLIGLQIDQKAIFNKQLPEQERDTDPAKKFLSKLDRDKRMASWD